MGTHERLQHELRQTTERLRQLGHGAIVEEGPGAGSSNVPPADLMDEVRLAEDREVRLTARELLVRRARRLADALDRLREGSYGVCEECEEPINVARLRAIPEVTTCIRCQQRQEGRALPVADARGGPASVTRTRGE